ncbi:MAG: hypothetical protein D3922_04270 [Candidatus Electrothrix sp. AR1]|nr:hypothetical protein [Candidatus Electrothrix sp. AR1]
MKRAKEKAPEQKKTAVNKEVITATLEAIEQNEPAENEEVSAEQESIEQEEPAGNEDAATTQDVSPLE